MVEKKPVNVNWQTLFAFIPIVWLWAFWRIEKLRLALLLLVGILAFQTVMAMLLPFPWGLGAQWAIQILPVIFFVRKWSREWNEKVGSGELNN